MYNSAFLRRLANSTFSLRGFPSWHITHFLGALTAFSVQPCIFTDFLKNALCGLFPFNRGVVVAARADFGLLFL